MPDRFLKKTRVSNAAQAMRNSLRAALQRNPVYEVGALLADHRAVREEWAILIKTAAAAYGEPVSDADHCAAI